MKKIFFTLNLFLVISMFSQSTYKEKIHSYELDEVREIRVYLPPSYHENETKPYPVAIVLDADYLFDLYVGNSVLFSQKEKAPEQIVIGISQGGDRRYVDCGYNEDTSYPSGRSESFYRFIRGELLNYLSSNYRISPFKTIVGNTLTANFASYLFIEEEPGFDAFIIINPYFAPNMAGILGNSINKVKMFNYHFYMSSGDYHSKSKQTQIKLVNEVLSEKSNTKFNYKYDEFNESSLTASISQSMPSAFSFIFDIFSAITKEEFETHVKDLSPLDAIAYLKNKYVNIEHFFGSNLKIRERDIYAIEPIIIDQENGKHLREFGEMIFELYPESPLGDYYTGLDFEYRDKYKESLDAFKSGYMKIEGDPAAAESFYKNIERVLNKVNTKEVKEGEVKKEEYEWEEGEY
ncbi:MAG: hypothetical protein KAH07_05400 [Flavobacteriaceae bacterium]|nr:hypothetical protein [Flavobacteriaceae bacterium]